MAPDIVAFNFKIAEWIAKPKPDWLIACLSGVMAGLSAPGIGWWPLMWFAWAPLMAIILNQEYKVIAKGWWWQPTLGTLRKSFFLGFISGFIYGGIYCLWCFDLHPLSWMGFGEWESRAVTLATWLLISIEQGILIGLLSVAFAFLRNKSTFDVRRADFLHTRLFPILWVLGFAGLLNATPLALPWALPEYTQASVRGFRWLVGMIGGGGLSFVIMLHNVVWASVMAEPMPKRFVTSDKQAALIMSAGLSLGLGLVAWVPLLEPTTIKPFDNHVKVTRHKPSDSQTFSIAVVQANLPIDVIRNGALSPEVVEDSYIRPVTESTLPAHTLLVYPEEGVIPGWVSRQNPQFNAGFRRLVRLAQEKNIFIVSGLSLADEQTGKRYNAVAVINPKPNSQPQFYLKRRLVPFGEFTPYGLGDWLKTTLAGFGVDYATGFSSGEAHPAPLQTDSLRIAPLICFELIDAMPWDAWWQSAPVNGFSRQYRQAGATILVNSSNLGWFHQNPLLEEQFLAIAQMRAAESHLPLIISANTGPSVILDSTGKIQGRLHKSSFFQHKSRILLYNGKL